MLGSGLITNTFFSALNLLLLALFCFKLFVFVDAAIRPARDRAGACSWQR